MGFTSFVCSIVFIGFPNHSRLCIFCKLLQVLPNENTPMEQRVRTGSAKWERWQQRGEDHDRFKCGHSGLETQLPQIKDDMSRTQ
ncbi:MAG: hypothetical protein Q4D92_08575 [Slackia sp.]|nr:hypothetical protein [Slackia sp.]